MLIVVCAVQANEAMNANFLGDNKTERWAAKHATGSDASDKSGSFSRALVFAIVGYFLVRAAIDHKASKAVSIDGARS